MTDGAGGPSGEIEKYAELVSEFSDSYSAIWRAAHGESGRPALLSGSLAARDRAKFRDPDAIDSLESQAAVLLLMGLDHLAATARSLHATPLAAAATTARGVLEASSFALWVLAPDDGTVERVRRSMRLRKTHIRGQRILLEARGEADVLPGKIAELDALAVQCGLGKLKQAPGITDVLSEVFNARSAYSLLSAIAHGEQWATTQSGFTQDLDGLRLKHQLHPSVAALVATWAVRWLAHATSAYESPRVS